MICPCCLNKMQHIDTVHDSGNIIDYYKCFKCECEIETGFDYCFATEDKKKTIYSEVEEYLKNIAHKYNVEVECQCNLFTSEIYVIIGKDKFCVDYTTTPLKEIKNEIDEIVVSLGNMATSPFTRKIVVTGKEAVDTIIDALVSDTPKKDPEEICRRKESLEKNRKKGRELLAQFASHYKK